MQAFEPDDTRAAAPSVTFPPVLTVSVVVGTLARHDAIANSCRQRVAALGRLCQSHGTRLRLRVYTYDCDTAGGTARRVSSPDQIVGDPHFQESDLVLYEFGIYSELFETIHAAPRAAGVVVFYHGITHPHVAPAAVRPVLYKSYEQLRNLFIADRVVVTSRFLERELLAAGLPASKLDRLPLPSPLEASAPAHRTRRDRLGPLRVLYVGRFVPAKGVADLIEAARLVSAARTPLRLDLAGSLRYSDRVYLRRLRAAARRLPSGSVGWHFDVPSDALRGLYESADVVVIPSYHEGFCVPVVEALGLGASVITSGAGALPETAGGLGLTAPAGNPAALADCLKRFDTGLRRGLYETDGGAVDPARWHQLVAAHLDQFRLERFEARFAEIILGHLPLYNPRMPRAALAGAALALHRRAAVGLPDAYEDRFAPRLERLVREIGLDSAASAGDHYNGSHADAAGEAPTVSGARLAWIRLKRGLKRVPFAGKVVVHAKRTLLMPRTVHHQHAVVRELHAALGHVSGQVDILRDELRRLRESAAAVAREGSDIAPAPARPAPRAVPPPVSVPREPLSSQAACTPHSAA